MLPKWKEWMNLERFTAHWVQEINKGERKPVSSRNRDMGFGKAVFSIVLEIDLVAVWAWVCVYEMHREETEIFFTWWRWFCWEMNDVNRHMEDRIWPKIVCWHLGDKGSFMLQFFFVPWTNWLPHFPFFPQLNICQLDLKPSFFS